MEKKTDSAARQEDSPFPCPAAEKQRRELWLYVAVFIGLVECLITVAALCYGFILSAGEDHRGVPGILFPWLSWGAAMAAAPALILLAMHFADVGLFTKGRHEGDEEWQRHLPERLQRLFTIVRGAPKVVVLACIAGLGVALITLDGALDAAMRFAGALKPHIPYIIGGSVAVVCTVVGGAAWLNYRTRKLYAEYEFRREVLERTGVIIVDKNSVPLAPGGPEGAPYAALVAGAAETKALPAGDDASLAGAQPAPETGTGQKDGVIDVDSR